VDGKVNLDFNDVQTVMKNGGVAILGSAQATGEGRARQAVEEALSSPLLNDSEIEGAQWILLNVTSAAGDHEHTLDELEIIQGYVQRQAGNTCDIILGMGHDPNLGENISVTIIATGFNHHEINVDVLDTKKEVAPEKIIVPLGQIGAQALVEAKAPEAPQPVVDPMAPVLVEAPVAQTYYQHVPQPVAQAEPAPVAEQKTSFNLELPQTQPVNAMPETKPQPQEYKAPELELIIKNEEKPVAQEPAVKRGERYLTAEELEEQRRFEEQKKALEDRADRLRRMSFNINGTEASEVENVPAYMRRQTNLDNTVNSNENFLSGYSVNDKDGKKGNISTINTFLDGKKPD
ncbi:MAG: cell division protein FtsZ, partial [Sphingobacteriales bacterium]